MILHLVHDEKIINRTIDVFNSVFPGKNIFVVFTNTELKLVNKSDNVFVLTEFNPSQYVFTSVVIHYLNSKKIKFINEFIDKKVPVFWIIWGADLYNDILSQCGFEMFDKTSTYFKSLRVPVFKKWHRHIKNKNRAKRYINFIKNKVQYLVTDTTEIDYDLLTSYVPKLKTIPWKDFFYYPIDVILGTELADKWVEGTNIQIGNSASITNNHEYVMRYLRQINVGERDIYVPLSYAGNAENTACVIRNGKHLFGNNFKPLTDFLPLNEYTRLMTSFNVALYGNWRQEAIGNIIISLYLGAKVFLPKQNPVTLWAEKHHLIVFELEKISQEEFDSPLNKQEQEHNRQILIELYNKDRMVKLIEDLGLL